MRMQHIENAVRGVPGYGSPSMLLLARRYRCFGWGCGGAPQGSTDGGGFRYCCYFCWLPTLQPSRRIQSAEAWGRRGRGASGWNGRVAGRYELQALKPCQWLRTVRRRDATLKGPSAGLTRRCRTSRRDLPQCGCRCSRRSCPSPLARTWAVTSSTCTPAGSRADLRAPEAPPPGPCGVVS